MALTGPMGENRDLSVGGTIMQEKGTQLVVNGKTGVGAGGPPPEDFCMFNL